MTIFGEIFPIIFGNDFKTICYTFTLKELRYELSSSFYFISDTEEGVTLFLQKAVIFKMKKKNERKRKHRVPEFSQKQEEKRPFDNLARNKTRVFLIEFLCSTILIFNLLCFKTMGTHQTCFPHLSFCLIIGSSDNI